MRASRLVTLPGKVVLTLLAAALPEAAVGQSSSVKFAALGDIGNSSNAAAVAKLTRSRSPELILMLGDLCYGSNPIAAQVNANYSAEKTAGKLRPALGNHEFNDACGGGNNASGYRAYFSLPHNERYYDFVRGPVHFFAINSFKEPDGTARTSRQALWLKGKLRASTSPWQVVFFHHPPFSSGGEHGSSLYMRWSFESWGADAVLAGHDHNYERILRDENRDGVKIPYFVSGLGGRSRRGFGTIVSGSEKRYNAAFGALFVTATSTSMKFEFRNTSGTLIDSYTRSKSSAEQTSDSKSATEQSSDPFEFRVPPPQ